MLIDDRVQSITVMNLIYGQTRMYCQGYDVEHTQTWWFQSKALSEGFATLRKLS